MNVFGLEKRFASLLFFRHYETFPKNFSKKWCFSRHFSSEKSPTITVASFLFFFVRPQTSSCMYHFLQKLLKLLRLSPANANLVQRVPFIFYLFLRNLQNRTRPKGPPFNFFGAVRNFFPKNFMSQRSPPSSPPSRSPPKYFATELYVNESQRVPFSFFGTIRHFRKKKVRSLFFNKSFFPVGEKVISQSYQSWKAHFGCLETSKLFAHDEVNVHCSPAKKVFFPQ